MYLPGRTQHGVLGVGAVQGTELPRFKAVVGLPAASQVRQVCAGAQHCVVRTAAQDGRERVWGCGDAPFVQDPRATALLSEMHAKRERTSWDESEGERG